MKTILYFENDKIIIQKSQKKADQNPSAIEIPLREGTIGNGVIFDSREIVDKLLDYKEEISGAVSFILDSTNIQIKRSEIPKLKKKQIKNLMADEFAYGANKEDLLISGVVEKQDESLIAITYAVDYEKVRSYMDIAVAVGFKVEKIDTLVNCIIKYVKGNPALEGETFIFNLMKENTLISLLFEKGGFVFAGRNRLLGEPGTDYYYREITEKLANIIQFSKTQKMETAITASYYVGLDSKTIAEVKRYESEAETGIDIKSIGQISEGSSPDTSETIASYVLEKNSSDVNFYKELKTFEKQFKSENRIKLNKLVVIPGVTVVAFVLIVAGLFIWNGILSGQLDDINNEIQAAQSTGSVDYEKIEANNALVDENSSINTALTNIENENHLASVDLNAVWTLAGTDSTITSVSYEQSTQTINLSGASDSENGAAEYTRKLRDSGMFTQVTYSGYSGGGGGGYSFTITASAQGGE